MLAIKTGLQTLIGKRDTPIGIADFVRNATVLDVGCGPSLDLPGAENRHELAAAYVGVDFSAQFALAARRRHPGERYHFAQGDVRSLPFPDDAFDTVLASFTIHHVGGDPQLAIGELSRVARKHVIIYDHLRETRPLRQHIQDLYWRVFDGGTNYLTADEWMSALAGLHIERRVRSGAIFGHVVKFACVPDRV